MNQTLNILDRQWVLGYYIKQWQSGQLKQFGATKSAINQPTKYFPLMFMRYLSKNW